MKECFSCCLQIIKFQPRRKICDNHSYCIPCVSKYYALKISMKCENCVKLLGKHERGGIMKWFWGISCKFCKAESNLILICDKHIICKMCLFQKFHPSFGANNDAKCGICLMILSRSCRNCFSILDGNDIVYKNSCGVHIYCAECKNIKIDKSLCEACQNHTEFFTQVSAATNPRTSSNEYFNRPKSPPVKILSTTNGNCTSPYFNVPQTLSQPSDQEIYSPDHKDSEINRFYSSKNFSNQNSPNTGLELKRSCSEMFANQSFGCVRCAGCGNNDFIVLECKHNYCFNCILQNFQRELVELLDFFEARNVSALNSREICLKCPAGDLCCAKFLFPFDIEYARGIENLNRYRFDAIWVLDRYSQYFDGARFHFFECKKCFSIVGCVYGLENCYSCQMLG